MSTASSFFDRLLRALLPQPSHSHNRSRKDASILVRQGHAAEEALRREGIEIISFGTAQQRFPLPLRQLAPYLESVLVEQQVAIRTVVHCLLRRASIWHENSYHPLALNFIGTPGSGKIYLARQIAISQSLPYVYFDMRMYRDNADQFLSLDVPFSAAQTSAQRPHLNHVLREAPNAVIVLNHVEQAHAEILRRLLALFKNSDAIDGTTAPAPQEKPSPTVAPTPVQIAAQEPSASSVAKPIIEESDVEDASETTASVVSSAPPAVAQQRAQQAPVRTPTPSSAATRAGATRLDNAAIAHALQRQVQMQQQRQKSAAASSPAPVPQLQMQQTKGTAGIVQHPVQATVIDARNAIFVLVSDVSDELVAQVLRKSKSQKSQQQQAAEIAEQLQSLSPADQLDRMVEFRTLVTPILYDHFSAKCDLPFFERMNAVVPFFPVSQKDLLEQIVTKLRFFAKKSSESSRQIRLTFGEDAILWLMKRYRANLSVSGLIETHVLTRLAEIDDQLQKGDVVHLSVGEHNNLVFKVRGKQNRTIVSKLQP